MTDVLVVGGGAIGCATAFFLAKQGAGVTLLERGELASEASGAAAGMLAALSDEGGDRGADFQRLCIDSLKLYESLLPELEATGIDLRYRRSGVLHLALNDEEARPLRRRFDAQRGVAPENRWLEGAALHAEEPAANLAAVAAVLSPSEHYLDPRRLVEALATACRKLGVTIRTKAPVTSFTRTSARLTGVRSGHESLHADAVVLASGAWTAELARRLGGYVPVRPIRGQMLSLRGPAEPLRHVIWGANGYLVPREDGQTFVGATVEDLGFRARTTQQALRGLRRAAAELVPELATAEEVRSWYGFRPAAPDALPIMGQLPGWENVWVSTGHFRNGILLAPISGLLIAESVLEGKPVEALSPFSPLRFVLQRAVEVPTTAAAH